MKNCAAASNCGTLFGLGTSLFHTSIASERCSTQVPKAKQTEWAGFSVKQRCQHVASLVERITILANNVQIKLTEAGCDLVSGATDSGLWGDVRFTPRSDRTADIPDR